MKSNPAVFTLTAVALLFGARTPASAQHPVPQAPSSARANPGSSTSFGTPLLTPIDQQRYVSAFVGCFPGFDSDYYEALDFEAFTGLAVAYETCGDAVAYQNSAILEDGIVASGYTNTEGGGSSSHVQVRFSVSVPVSYRATGYLFGGSCALRDQLGPLFSISGATETFVDELGLLMPGEYVFEFDQFGQFGDIILDGQYDIALDLDPCDTTPPLLSYPSSVSVIDEKGGTPGESVFFSVTAADAHDPSPTVVCVPPSGSFFPRGTTMVTCTATDASGNQSMCTFPVVVQPTVQKHRL